VIITVGEVDAARDVKITCVDDATELRPLASMLARRAAGLMLCVDAGSPDSLESVRLWLDEAMLGFSAPPRALVVVLSADSSFNPRVVDTKDFARSIDAQCVMVASGDSCSEEELDASAAELKHAIATLLDSQPPLTAANARDGPAASAASAPRGGSGLARMPSNQLTDAASHVPETAPAVVVAAFGGPEAMTVVEDHPVPTPGPGQCLIRVRAAGVNPVDTYVRSGAYARLPALPYTPGLDCAGELVTAVPAPSNDDEDADSPSTGLPDWAEPGTPVFTSAAVSGSYAAYAVAPLARTFPFTLADAADAAAASPAPGLTWAQAAAIPTPYFTAYRALKAGSGIAEGSAVLVHGASGAVGLAAVAIAARMGCRVVGTASSEAGLAAVVEAGAVAATGHGDVEALVAALRGPVEGGAAPAPAAAAPEGAAPGTAGGPRGFDVIVENLASANLGTDLALLARRGRVAVVGSRGEVTVNPRDLMAREASVHGVAMAMATDADVAAMMDDIGDWLCGAGNLRASPVVGSSFDGLAMAGAAHVDVMSHPGGARGKVVIVVAGDKADDDDDDDDDALLAAAERADE